MERLWTDIRDWATGDHGATYKKRDKILGKPMQDTYSIDNTILRETRSTIWRARYTNTITTIDQLKNRLKRQIPTLLHVITKQPLKYTT